MIKCESVVHIEWRKPSNNKAKRKKKKEKEKHKKTKYQKERFL